MGMIEIKGNDIYRGGVKMGWVNGNHIYDNRGEIRGYFSADTVYDEQGRLMARIESPYVYAGEKRIELEHIFQNIEGVGISDSGKVAVLTFLGD